MKPLYGRRLSSRHWGIPLHGLYGPDSPGPRRASDGGGAVGHRMLGYGLLAARIEDMGQSDARREAGTAQCPAVAC